MKDFATGALLLIISVIALMGLAWAIQGNNFFMYQFFAPKYEQTRREVFEQSKAYNQGVQQELQSMQFQWYQAKPEHRAALADLILHRVADYDVRQLTPELRTFINELREGQRNKEDIGR